MLGSALHVERPLLPSTPMPQPPKAAALRPPDLVGPREQGNGRCGSPLSQLLEMLPQSMGEVGGREPLGEFGEGVQSLGPRWLCGLNLGPSVEWRAWLLQRLSDMNT